jgi:hypothetical protein
VRVEFEKPEDKGRPRCVWRAVRGKRTRIPGTTTGVRQGLPHDLAQYVIEAATGCESGFWGCLEKGATFKSTGRRRTRPGRAVIAAHRDDLDASEQLASAHLAAWHRGDRTAVAAALDVALEQWRAIGPGERLVFAWPSPTGLVERGGSE